jgi:hypothetical protein
MLWWQGILSNPNVPQPLLLDAAKFSETGHLSQDAANKARGSASEVGQYQIRSDNLNNLGYGMPTNFDVKDLEDQMKARGIASDYISRFSAHHGFTTPLEKLAAYNMGPNKAARWKAAGGRFEDLPATTQKYVLRAARYIDDQAQQVKPEVNNKMDVTMMNEWDQPVPKITIQDDWIQGRTTGRFAWPENEASYRRLQSQRIDPSTINDPYNPAPRTNTGANSEMESVNIDSSPITADRVKQDAAQLAADVKSLGTMSSSAQAADPAGDVSPDAILQQTFPEYGYNTENGLLYDPNVGYEYGLDQTQNNGALSNVTPLGGNSNAGALSFTGDTRSMTAFSMPRKPSQATTGEMLVRMGAAGMGGAMKSGGAAMEAIGKEYGAFKKEQRANEMERYKSDNTLLGKLKDKLNKSAAGGSAYQENVLGSIASIEQAVKTAADDWNPFNNVTGFIGNAMSYIPGSAAHDVASMIEQVEANIGFDRLQKMRDESPTGGALGQVSEMELTLLKSSLASLRQSQSREQFMYNLQRVKDHYQRATQAIDRQRQAYQGGLVQQGQQIGGSSAITTQSGNNIQVRRIGP